MKLNVKASVEINYKPGNVGVLELSLKVYPWKFSSFIQLKILKQVIYETYIHVYIYIQVVIEIPPTF